MNSKYVMASRHKHRSWSMAVISRERTWDTQAVMFATCVAGPARNNSMPLHFNSSPKCTPIESLVMRCTATLLGIGHMAFSLDALSDDIRKWNVTRIYPLHLHCTITASPPQNSSCNLEKVSTYSKKWLDIPSRFFYQKTRKYVLMIWIFDTYETWNTDLRNTTLGCAYFSSCGIIKLIRGWWMCRWYCSSGLRSPHVHVCTSNISRHGKTFTRNGDSLIVMLDQ